VVLEALEMLRLLKLMLLGLVLLVSVGWQFESSKLFLSVTLSCNYYLLMRAELTVDLGTVSSLPRWFMVCCSLPS
jgi:hypothetical protein